MSQQKRGECYNCAMRTMPDLDCWKCGFSLSQLTLPIGRRDVCPACDAELHVCRGCVDYDPSVAQQCREPTAESVSDKTRANFCGHFAPKAFAYVADDKSEVSAAEAQLQALFGDAPDGEATQDAGSDLDQLFSGFPKSND